MLIVKRILNRILVWSEFLIVYSLGKLFGISLIVKYLRNPNPKITAKLLRSFGATIGEKTTFKRSLIFDNVYEDEHSAKKFSHLKIGDNCYIGDFAYFDLAHEIILGNNVVISGKVSIVTHADCNRSPYLAQKFPRQCDPVRIYNDAWIGFGATILSGVTIGVNAVIGANSLVRKDVDSLTLVAGVPATKIKDVNNFEQEYDINSGKKSKESPNLSNT